MLVAEVTEFEDGHFEFYMVDADGNYWTCKWYDTTSIDSVVFAGPKKPDYPLRAKNNKELKANIKKFINAYHHFFDSKTEKRKFELIEREV